MLLGLVALGRSAVADPPTPKATPTPPAKLPAEARTATAELAEKSAGAKPAKIVPRPIGKETKAIGAAQISVREARRGDLLLRGGQMQGAAQAYALAALAAPKQPVPRLAAGILLAEIGEEKRATEQFRRAWILAEDDVIAAFLLQNALSAQGDTREAQEIYQDTYRRFGIKGKPGLNTDTSLKRLQAASAEWEKSPVLSLLLGDAYQLAEDFANADIAYQKAILLAPLWAKPRVNLGISRLAQGKTDQAILTFETALALDPRNTQARLWKGEGELRSGRNAEALMTLQPVAKSAQVSPQVAVQAMNGMGQALANTRQFTQAFATLDRARIVAPSDPTTPTIIGDVRMQRGEADAAVSAYQTALNLTQSGSLFSNRSALLRSLAEAQLSAGRFNDTQVTVNLALKEDADNAPLWYRLSARAFQSQGDAEHVQEALTSALRAEDGLYPQDTLRAVDAAKLLPVVKAQFQRELDNPETVLVPRLQDLSALASIARYEGQTDREVALRQRLIAVRPKARAWDYFLMGEVYDQKLGQTAPAREAYEAALKIGGLSDAAARVARQRLKEFATPPAP